MTATTSPPPTDAPSLTRTSVTVPALSAPMAFSIFMASSTQMVWPISTVSPGATSTRTRSLKNAYASESGCNGWRGSLAAAVRAAQSGCVRYYAALLVLGVTAVSFYFLLQS